MAFLTFRSLNNPMEERDIILLSKVNSALVIEYYLIAPLLSKFIAPFLHMCNVTAEHILWIRKGGEQL